MLKLLALFAALAALWNGVEAKRLPAQRVMAESPAPGRCGPAFGGQVCPTGCCSQFNWCGFGDAWCGVQQGCLAGYGQCASTNGQCGPNFGRCSGTACCSQFSWCGYDSQWCGSGCQQAYGLCTRVVQSVAEEMVDGDGQQLEPGQYHQTTIEVMEGIEIEELTPGQYHQKLVQTADNFEY